MVTVCEAQSEGPFSAEGSRHRGRHGHVSHRHLSPPACMGRRHHGGPLRSRHGGFNADLHLHCHRGTFVQTHRGNSVDEGGPAGFRGHFLGPRGHCLHWSRRGIRSLSPGALHELRVLTRSIRDSLAVELVGRGLGAPNHHRHCHHGHHRHRHRHHHYGFHGRHERHGHFGHHPHHVHPIYLISDLQQRSPPSLVVPEIVDGMAQLQLTASS